MELTVVMYHYVRDLDRSRYPAIKGLRTSEFREQLEHLRRNYTVVRMEDVAAALVGGEKLPPRAALLTFDDGYIDHYITAFPILMEFGFQGSFFPPAGPVVRGELLDVNRIHFILASMRDPTTLIATIDDFVREHQHTHTHTQLQPGQPGGLLGQVGTGQPLRLGGGHLHQTNAASGVAA